MAIVPEELTDMWICGWMRSSRIRDGALCRFQPIEILKASHGVDLTAIFFQPERLWQ
jgi:hypothetical protein